LTEVVGNGELKPSIFEPGSLARKATGRTTAPSPLPRPVTNPNFTVKMAFRWLRRLLCYSEAASDC